MSTLGLLALLSLLGLLLEEWSLSRSVWDAAEVNLAGRQRMLSERMVKQMLIATYLPSRDAPQPLRQLAGTLATWQTMHTNLWHGDAEHKSHGARSETVEELLHQIDPSVEAFAALVGRFLAAAAISLDHDGLETILRRAIASQQEYVNIMDRLVATMAQDAATRLEQVRLIGQGVVVFTLLVLLLSGLFLLRPTSRELSEVMGRIDRERRGLAGFVRDTPSPIVQLRPDGKFISCNPGAERFLDLLPGPPDDRASKAESLFRGCLGGTETPLTCRDVEVPAEGRHYLFHFIHAMYSDQIFALGIDITERKEAEKAMAQARDAAETANKLKSDFLATMSHELRTPLNAIIGFSEALLSGTYGEVQPKQERKLEHIRTSGRRLLSLVDAVLDLSQIEAGRMTLNPSEVSLEALLQDGLSMISQTAASAGLTTSAEISPEARGLEMMADERKLKQVLFNLLSNAVKFTPRGGWIKASARLEDGQALVSVADSGLGFTPEEARNLFQTFSQGDSSLNRHYEGTGLGLALCRRLVELHGGRIWASSEGKNRGSVFSIALPLERPGEAAERAAE